MRKQIISPMQWGAVNGGAPFDQRMGFMAPPFSSFWGSAHWELENLALFNQAAYRDVIRRNDQLDDAAAAMKRIRKPDDLDDDQDEVFETMLARKREHIIGGEIEVEAIARYADEVTVIATWAFAEKHLNMGLSPLRAELGLAPVTDHKWPVIEKGYKECGIVLSKLSSFADADECRRVNNAIKHGGVVSSSLAAVSAFNGKEGDPLEKVELAVQRYFFGVADFVSAVFEEASTVKAGASSP